MNPFTHKLRKLSKGFSLAEVIMAVGITAIGVTSLIGLVPAGLDSLRQSAARVAQTKIIQAVTADFQMGDWGQRNAGQMLTDREYSFDEQGLIVPKDDPWRHYSVKATIERNADESSGIKLFGDPTGNRYIYRLVIRITDKRDADAAFADNSGNQYTTHASMVAFIEQTGSLRDLK